MKRLVILSLVLSIVAAPSLTLGGRASQLDQRRMPIEDGFALRLGVEELLDRSERLGRVLQFDPNTMLELDRAREQLASAPIEEFDALVNTIGPQIEQMNAALAELEALLNEPAPEQPQATGGFPDANYPSTGWDFVIEAVSEDAPDGEPDAEGGSSPEQNEGALCNKAGSKSADQMFALLTISTTAEAAQMVADRICNQVIVVVAGANTSLVCIITDILFLVARSVYDYTLLCETWITAAEVTGNYDRLEHIHGDIETFETDISAQLAQHDADVRAELSQHDADIKAALADHDADIKAAIAQHDAEIKAVIAQHDADIKELLNQVLAGQALALQLEIENALRHYLRIAEFYLPEAHGGRLELVRQIVVDTVTNNESAGITVTQQGYLDTADAAAAAGDYKTAFHWYSAVYCHAVRFSGEVCPVQIPSGNPFQ